MGKPLKPIRHEPIPQDIVQAVHRLVKSNRLQCLWFMKEDYVPRTPLETDGALAAIELYGDRRAWIEARNLRAWLLRNTSAES